MISNDQAEPMMSLAAEPAWSSSLAATTEIYTSVLSSAASDVYKRQVKARAVTGMAGAAALPHGQQNSISIAVKANAQHLLDISRSFSLDPIFIARARKIRCLAGS